MTGTERRWPPPCAGRKKHPYMARFWAVYGCFPNGDMRAAAGVVRRAFSTGTLEGRDFDLVADTAGLGVVSVLDVRETGDAGGFRGLLPGPCGRRQEGGRSEYGGQGGGRAGDRDSGFSVRHYEFPLILVRFFMGRHSVRLETGPSAFSYRNPGRSPSQAGLAPPNPPSQTKPGPER